MDTTEGEGKENSASTSTLSPLFDMEDELPLPPQMANRPFKEYGVPFSPDHYNKVQWAGKCGPFEDGQTQGDTYARPTGPTPHIPYHLRLDYTRRCQVCWVEGVVNTPWYGMDKIQNFPRSRYCPPHALNAVWVQRFRDAGSYTSLTAGYTPPINILGITFIASLIHKENLLLATIKMCDPAHLDQFKLAVEYYRQERHPVMEMTRRHVMQPQLEQEFSVELVNCSMCGTIYKRASVKEITPDFHYPPHSAPPRILCHTCLHSLSFVCALLHCFSILVDGCEPSHVHHQELAMGTLGAKEFSLAVRPFRDIQGPHNLDHIFS